jgi:four helix bundle protein
VVRGEGSGRVAFVGVQGFRQLDVYRRAAALSDELRRCVIEWASFDRWTVGQQLVRAADSVGANIAEGCGRAHKPDQRRLFFIARASAWELEHWLDRATARGLDLPAGAANEAGELSRMLNGLTRT